MCLSYLLGLSERSYSILLLFLQTIHFLEKPDWLSCSGPYTLDLDDSPLGLVVNVFVYFPQYYYMYYNMYILYVYVYNYYYVSHSIINYYYKLLDLKTQVISRFIYFQCRYFMSVCHKKAHNTYYLPCMILKLIIMFKWCLSDSIITFQHLKALTDISASGFSSYG